MRSRKSLGHQLFEGIEEGTVERVSRERRSFQQGREKKARGCLFKATVALTLAAGVLYAGYRFEGAQVMEYCRSTAQKIGDLFSGVVEERPDLQNGGGHARHAIDPDQVIKDNEQ